LQIAAADATAARRLAGASPDVGQAITAARRVLDAYPDVVGQVRLVPGGVEVSTSTQVETVFLSLIGINTLAATGSATAELREA